MRAASDEREARRTDNLDLSVLERSAAFDRLIALARCAAAVFFVMGAIVQPGDDATLTVLIGCALCLGSVLGMVAPREWTNRPFFGLASFVFDGMIITLMLTNALSDPNDIVWTTALLVVFEGARWGRRGGIIAGTWMGLTTALWTAEVQQRAGIQFELEPLLHRFGVFLILGWGVGTMIHRLQQQRSAIQKVVESSHDGMLTISRKGFILSGNESAELIFGLGAEEFIGSRFSDLLASGPEEQTALEVLTGGQTCEFEVADEPGRWVEAALTDVGELGYSFIVCRDVTARANRTRRLAHDAHHDDLTQLANRRRLMQELSAALDPKRAGQAVSLLLIDLDDFKRINDTLGHMVGDELLVAIAERLGRLVRPSDVAVRLGGDEFAVMMRGTRGIAAAQALSERIGAVLNQPVQIGAATATVSASIGYTTGTPETTTVDHMFHDADVALYAAKAQGKNMAVAHRPGLAEEFLDGRAMAEDLSAAFSSGEGLTVLYQPICTLDEPRGIVAVEALCRWTHPELGAMLPEAFVASAEKAGLACELDRFVRRRAMADIARADAGHLVELHVNLSASTLGNPDLLRVLLEDAATTDFNLGRLVLEITEAVAIVETDQAVETLTRLRELGAKIAIDDFGTGQASLASLRWIPLDMLKIDRSFVHGSGEQDVSDAALVDTVLQLGESMQLSVVAEGIETEEQLATLAAAGCRFGQGFLLGRPVAIDEMAELLRSRIDQPPVAV